MTLKSLTEWAARNDPNGDWDELVPVADGNDVELKMSLTCDLILAYRRWAYDTDSEKQRAFLWDAINYLEQLRNDYIPKAV